MKKNVGATDKIIRFIIAAVALYIAYAGFVESPWSYVLYAVSGIMIVTALMNSCPIFSIFGISTQKKKQH